MKEQIRPDLTDADQLKTMFYSLQDAWRNCDDLPEILYYENLVAERLNEQKALSAGDQKQLVLIQKDLQRLKYQPAFGNPLARPEAASDPLPSKVGHKWALVVGINEFKDAVVPALRFAVNDASSFAQFLTDPKGGRFQKDRVTTLLNEQATFAGVRSGLGWLREKARPEDLVVIYISSHGSPRNVDPNGVSYIIMNDTSLDDPAKLYGTSLQMIDLVQQINSQLKARRVVLFLDTCYSGDSSQAGREGDGSKRIMPVWAEGQAPPSGQPEASLAFSAALNNLKIGEGRAVITASRANEESWEDNTLKHGYFTYYLIDSLRKQPGLQTLGDIFPKLKERVAESVRKDHQGVKQTPSAEFSQQAATIVISVPEDIKAGAGG